MRLTALQQTAPPLTALQVTALWLVALLLTALRLTALRLTELQLTDLRLTRLQLHCHWVYSNWLGCKLLPSKSYGCFVQDVSGTANHLSTNVIPARSAMCAPNAAKSGFRTATCVTSA